MGYSCWIFFALIKVLVTGTSTGIGRAVTEYALAQGDRVVATLRKPEALVSLSTKYSSDPGSTVQSTGNKTRKTDMTIVLQRRCNASTNSHPCRRSRSGQLEHRLDHRGRRLREKYWSASRTRQNIREMELTRKHDMVPRLLARDEVFHRVELHSAYCQRRSSDRERPSPLTMFCLVGQNSCGTSSESTKIVMSFSSYPY